MGTHFAGAGTPRTCIFAALRRPRNRVVAEANADLRRLDLTPRGGGDDLLARRRAIFAWNVWDKGSTFYGTATAKALREPDPVFICAQDVWAVLYEKVR